MKTPALCWLRRDLRLHDHAALSAALERHEDVHLVFCFDTQILSKLKDKEDRRLTFIIESLEELETELQKRGSSLHILHGDPVVEIPRLAATLKCSEVYANRDYEPYAKKRDEAVAKKVTLHHFKDAVVFEQGEVLNGSNEVYKVFTPYKNRWLLKLAEQDHMLPNHSVKLKTLAQWENQRSILKHDWHRECGFTRTPAVLTGGTSEARRHLKSFKTRIQNYEEGRNTPSIDGTSNLSAYIRHGCLSIRDMVRASLESNDKGSQVWLSELVWRDFYQVILDHFPHVEKNSFKPQYDAIKWRGKEAWFVAWCEGRTGFPIVDASMRCLNQTGMMHNRLRMVVASFLCKTLLIDWRRGERYFAEKLLDYDLAANSGGWQWSSSSGCDAQPYFRIFNPYSQTEKFDPEAVFIRAWIPELDDPSYPSPIVSYEKMRKEALDMYGVVKTSLGKE
mgnify:CR=1 FL=1